MTSEYKTLEDTARNTFCSVTWSHKIQEKQVDIFATQYKYLEIANIVSASLTSVGIVSLIFTDELWLKLVSALISFVSIFASSFLKSFDLSTKVNAHKNCANKLLAIRNEFQILLLKINLEQEEIDNLIKSYEELVIKLNKIYSGSPNTCDKAVKKAQKSLKINQDNTFTNEEIDSFLPEALRRNK